MKKNALTLGLVLAMITSIFVPARATEPLVLDGTGQVMAIIDVGFDTTLPSIKGRVIAEACFAQMALIE